MQRRGGMRRSGGLDLWGSRSNLVGIENGGHDDDHRASMRASSIKLKRMSKTRSQRTLLNA